MPAISRARHSPSTAVCCSPSELKKVLARSDYLNRFELDSLKLDRSFVWELGPDGDGDAAIVTAVVRLARSLGLDLVVEGVETLGQLRTLRGLGCRFLQGYLFARPMEIGALRDWLRARQQRPSAAA